MEEARSDHLFHTEVTLVVVLRLFNSFSANCFFFSGESGTLPRVRESYKLLTWGNMAIWEIGSKLHNQPGGEALNSSSCVQ